MSAAAMTYDSLVEDIQTYAERDDDPFVAQIPRFIMLCENRLASTVRGLGFRKAVNGTLNGATLAKPERWRETANFSILTPTGRKFLFERAYEYCRMYWPDSAQTDVPQYYADYDYEHFLIVPTPDSAYSLELMYYERPEPLSVDNQTNWTTQYAPQLLLYGALLEAQPFLKLPERIPEFKALYDEAVQAVMTEAMRRSSDRSANARES